MIDLVHLFEPWIIRGYCFLGQSLYKKTCGKKHVHIYSTVRKSHLKSKLKFKLISSMFNTRFSIKKSKI